MKKFSYTLCSCALILVALASPNAYAKLPKPVCSGVCDTQRATHGHCIQVGKNKLYYRKQGAGKPTIIFASGTGFPADAWFETKIASEISKHNQVLTYDRLYTFNSCANANDYMPNTAQDVVNRLRNLLHTLNLKPPYVLVGHSFGGLYMLLYAREYPNEVAGLLLMDATSDDGPTPLPTKALPILERKGNPQTPIPTKQLYNEEIGQLPSYLQMRAAPTLLRTMPLIVMYATKHCLPTELTGGKQYCMNQHREKNHIKQQLKIYNMSDNHALYKIKGDHMSFFDKEKLQIVLKAFRQLLRMTKPA